MVCFYLNGQNSIPYDWRKTTNERERKRKKTLNPRSWIKRADTHAHTKHQPTALCTVSETWNESNRTIHISIDAVSLWSVCSVWPTIIIAVHLMAIHGIYAKWAIINSKIKAHWMRPVGAYSSFCTQCNNKKRMKKACCLTAISKHQDIIKWLALPPSLVGIWMCSCDKSFFSLFLSLKCEYNLILGAVKMHCCELRPVECDSKSILAHFFSIDLRMACHFFGQ